MITAFKRIMILTTMVGCAAVSANASTYTFDGGGVGHDWSDPANWDPYGTPDGDDTAIIPNGLTCEIADANQSIHILTINSGGVLQIKGKDLTMAGWTPPLNRLTVNGRLEFLKPGNDDPRLLIYDDLGITGSGVVSASDGDSLDPGIIEFVNPYYSDLTIDGATVKGSVKIRTSVRLLNNGQLLVDDDDDVMEIGYMSATPLRDILGNDDGTFKVTDGTMRFGAVRPQYLGPKFHSKWKVQGGTLELTEYAATWWIGAEHPVEVSGGTLELNTCLGTSGLLSFTGGEIGVAAGRYASFWTPQE